MFEAQMGSTAFMDLPVWIPELIIPATFGIMTLRYALCLLRELVE
jgi:TRAP-type C4-dicarboxylate transport system permease small subunit